MTARHEPGQSVAVVGGGPAGMMAAIIAARSGGRVTLIERNEKLGKKLYITGKGRCNVTNIAVGEGFIANVARNPMFMMSSMAAFDSGALVGFLRSLGLETKIERGGRVFPASDKASDVTRALARELDRLGVRVMLNARVAEVMADRDGHAAFCGFRLEGGAIVEANAGVIATGGASYPSTGSTGDGYRLLEAVGHTIIPVRPSLTSIITREDRPGRLAGLTLKNVTLTATRGKRRLYQELGELLFTHSGISGPLALSLSALLPDDYQGQAVKIDLKPALSDDVLESRLLRELSAMPRSQLLAVMSKLCPRALASEVLGIAGLSPTMPCHQLTQQGRRALINAVKGLPLTVAELGGMDEAVVTRGGLSVREVNPSTMESKLIKGLYAAGELLDVDALTGGFNLQIAFSTGYVAGKSCAG